MSSNDYMEDIIDYMVKFRNDLSEMTIEEKERMFKSRARKHNPAIDEGEIQDYWNHNSHRV
jgi:hypothetical protein